MFRTHWGLFVGLWTLSLVIDRAKRGMLDGTLSILLVVAVAWLAVQPKAWRRFLLVALLQSIWFVRGYEKEAMVHWYIAFSFHASILLLVISSWFKRPFNIMNGLRGAEEFWPSIIFTGRFLSFTGVAFAGLAKLNWDFMDPEIGCGAVYYLWVRESPLLRFWLPESEWAREFAIYITCICELAGPLLTLIPRTRSIGLILIWLIMFSLGFNVRSHYFEFSGLFIAMSIFWLPSHVIHRAANDLKSAYQKLISHLPSTMRQESLRLVYILLVLELLVAVMLGTHYKPWRRTILETQRYIWLTTVGVVLGFTLWHMLTMKREDKKNGSRKPLKIVAWIIPAIFLLNEITPYLGLGHLPTMTMASNGRFFSGNTNHIIFDHPITIPWSRDVELIKANKAAKRAGLHKGRHLAWILLVDRIRQNPKARVEYKIADSEEIFAAKNGEGPDFPKGSIASMFSWTARAMRLSSYQMHRGPQVCRKPPPRVSQKAWRKTVLDRIKWRMDQPG